MRCNGEITDHKFDGLISSSELNLVAVKWRTYTSSRRKSCLHVEE